MNRFRTAKDTDAASAGNGLAGRNTHETSTSHLEWRYAHRETLLGDSDISCFARVSFSLYANAETASDCRLLMSRLFVH
jgi:hypothetical protein